jgi:hypothetical protein
MQPLRDIRAGKLEAFQTDIKAGKALALVDDRGMSGDKVAFM